VTCALDRLDAQRGRRVAVAIQAVQLALAPDQRKRIAAQAAAGGFHHGKRRRRGDGRINGIAALLHDFDTGLGGQGLGRGDHAAPGEHALALRRIGIFVGREVQHGKSS
jgi:hypothetical protein